MTRKSMTVDDVSGGRANVDSGRQDRRQSEFEIQDWDENAAREIAGNEGIDLTDEHMEVVQLLREFYLANGMAQNGRELGDLLDEAFEGQGGRRYLRRLFPNGPVTQGMRIAGLPVPELSVDAGFGTAR